MGEKFDHEGTPVPRFAIHADLGSEEIRGAARDKKSESHAAGSTAGDTFKFIEELRQVLRRNSRSFIAHFKATSVVRYARRRREKAQAIY